MSVVATKSTETRSDAIEQSREFAIGFFVGFGAWLAVPQTQRRINEY